MLPQPASFHNCQQLGVSLTLSQTGAGTSFLLNLNDLFNCSHPPGSYHGSHHFRRPLTSSSHEILEHKENSLSLDTWVTIGKTWVLAATIDQGVCRTGSFLGLSPWLQMADFSLCPHRVLRLCVLCSNLFLCDTGHIWSKAQVMEVNFSLSLCVLDNCSVCSLVCEFRSSLGFLRYSFSGRRLELAEEPSQQSLLYWQHWGVCLFLGFFSVPKVLTVQMK